MTKTKFLRAFAVLAAGLGMALAQAATSITPPTSSGFVMKRDTTAYGVYPTRAACWVAAHAHAENAKKSGNYTCAEGESARITYREDAPPPPPVCPSAPASSQTQQCPAGTTGTTWDQTRTVVSQPHPTCWAVGSWTPASAPAAQCPPIQQPTGTVYYFSDCAPGAAAGCVPGVNSNPGTAAAPKRNLDSTNLDALPANTRLLFNRGGAWSTGMIVLENPNTSAANPLVFDAYGTGPAPLFRVPSGFTGNMFNVGGGWGNTSNDGGYVIRNLKLDGDGTGDWGVWFIQNVRDVVIENTEITGFRIAINSNDGAPYGVSGVTLRNNNIHHNRAMGLLGHYDNMLIEGNLFEANNFGGSTFDHGTYIGGGNNITLRNNRYIRNSTVNGTCTGGNMTFHGQIDGLLIEGNTIEQDAATDGCWLMSITRGYDTAEWFRNAVVRNNKLINGGNTAMAVQSAPGIVVDGNVVINSNPRNQTAFSIGVGSAAAADGDVGDTGAVVTNNTYCRSHASGTGSVTAVNSPGGSVTNNVLITGAAATTGVCTR